MSEIKLIITDEVSIKITNLPLDVRRKISSRLQFEVPYARHLPLYKLGHWDGKVNFFNIGGSGFLHHLDIILKILEENNISIDDIEDNRKNYNIQLPVIDENYLSDITWPKKHNNAGEQIILRDYQVDAINNYLENHQCLQEITTAGGKTIVIATLSKICEQYGNTMIIVPNKSLVLQTEEDYKNIKLDVGVYYGDRKETNHKHTIVTWQSLNALNKKSKLYEDKGKLEEIISKLCMVMVDEAHTVKGNVLKELLTNVFCNVPIRWGITGTIPKQDHEFHCLLTSLGPVINRIRAKELQDKGVLSNCKVSITQLIDYGQYKLYPDESKYLTKTKERVEFIAKQIINIAESGNTLVLVSYIETGKILQENIPDSHFIYGSVKVKDRKDVFDEINFENNKIMIATYGTCAVGINITRLYNVVLIEPGKSFIRVIQSIGRGLRKTSDKDFVNIYDFASTLKYSAKHLTERKKWYKEVEYPHTVKKIEWQ